MPQQLPPKPSTASRLVALMNDGITTIFIDALITGFDWSFDGVYLPGSWTSTCVFYFVVHAVWLVGKRRNSSASVNHDEVARIQAEMKLSSL